MSSRLPLLFLNVAHFLTHWSVPSHEVAMPSVLNDPKLEALLAALHARSDSQEQSMAAYYAVDSGGAPTPHAEDEKAFLSDKLVALDRDKAEFCYQLCRALKATRVVRSRRLCVRSYRRCVDNRAAGSAAGVVIGTGTSPPGGVRPRAFAAAVSRRSSTCARRPAPTLRDVGGPVDFMLVDIWTPMARPARLVAPRLPRRRRHLRQHRRAARSTATTSASSPVSPPPAHDELSFAAAQLTVCCEPRADVG
jgi:hypothetical protein